MRNDRLPALASSLLADSVSGMVLEEMQRLQLSIDALEGCHADVQAAALLQAGRG